MRLKCIDRQQYSEAKNSMNAIISRIKVWRYLGYLTFSQALMIMLPAFLRPKKNSPVRLFGRDLLLPDGEKETADFISVVREVIIENQHHIELIKSNGVVVDAGANVGVFSIFVATKHPDSTIYAFEPTPSTFAVLKENTKYYPNIKVFNCGLGDKNETSTIVTAAHSGGNYIGVGGSPIEVKTIDGLNIPMDFLKIDTEGYEANILKGAAETIKKYKPILALSAYHKPNDKKELPELVNSIAPYNCELLHGADLICKPK
jgi:FkbM family methyltransferase